MNFQHTWQQVLDGTKTQTRRLVKPCSGAITYQGDIYEVHSGSSKRRAPTYAVGHTYAVQPGRGKPAIARICVTDIRREDVRHISEDDARAEGFYDTGDFWFTWVSMHDKSFLETYRYAHDCDYLREYGFYERPAARYDAWVLTFCLVKGDGE